MQEVRLQKYVSDCGIMSRRACEEHIKNRLFKINGKIAVLGQKVDPDTDVVEYNGIIIEPRTEKKVYLALYKPRGYVTTLNDEKGRKCITELIGEIPERVYPIGRLDMASEGLLLLTNDGAVADKLMHPREHVAKIYNVKCRGKLTSGQIQALTKTIDIDGRKTTPAIVELIKPAAGGDTENTMLRITLYEGRNRQIRRLCESEHIDIMILRRVAIGELTLSGLRPGECRYLNREQISYLKNLGTYTE